MKLSPLVDEDEHEMRFWVRYFSPSKSSVAITFSGQEVVKEK
jgi:hypothetical protein